MLNWTCLCRIILAPATKQYRQPGGQVCSTGCITSTGPRNQGFGFDKQKINPSSYKDAMKICKIKKLPVVTRD